MNCYIQFSSDILNERMIKENQIRLETSLQRITNSENGCMKCYRNSEIFHELNSLLKNQRSQIEQEKIFRSIRSLTNCLSILNLILAYITCRKFQSIHLILSMIFLQIIVSFYVKTQNEIFYFHLIVIITSIIILFVSVYIAFRYTFYVYNIQSNISIN